MQESAYYLGKSTPSGHPNIIVGLTNLANYYSHQELYDPAEPLYARALNLNEQTPLVEASKRVGLFHNSANLYAIKGEIERAESLYAKALEIYDDTLELEVYKGLMLKHLGALYQASGRYALADTLYRLSLVIHELKLPPRHSETADLLTAMASLYREMGNDGETEVMEMKLSMVKSYF